MVVTERSASCSSDDFFIQPLGVGDFPLEDRVNEYMVTSNHESENIPEPGEGNRFFSAVFGIATKHTHMRKTGKPAKSSSGISRSMLIRMRWRNAAYKARQLGDPWEKFHLDTYKTENAKRYRYSSIRQKWVTDDVVVKMEPHPFGNGAMRECYRMKKLSNFQHEEDWAKAHNYVAKKYMDVNSPREVYFSDVKLQMDAKLWGEEYNRHNPPKKVDIFQMAILEFTDREGKPLYHLEHFIEGDYIKYNSNSGFVTNRLQRNTPHAFSHFTFEKSGHELIVVDIQGCGDLYTDPQIHSHQGTDYGDGNLGTRGMALFFHSHQCNSICKSLALTPFDLAPSEITERQSKRKPASRALAKTVVRGTEEMVISPSHDDVRDIHQYIRQRSLSMSSGYMSGEENHKPNRVKFDSISSLDSLDSYDMTMAPDDNEDSAFASAKREDRRPRIHLDSESSLDRESEINDFKNRVEKRNRPSHVLGELEHQEMIEKLLLENDEQSGDSDDQETTKRKERVKKEGSVLGKIHLDLAKYHELNRFVEESETYDHEAALYHLTQAAKCGVLDAIKTVADLHMGLPHDVLPDIELSDSVRNMAVGFDHLIMAAEANDRAAMLHIAKAFHTGYGLPANKDKNWKDAVYWYNKVVETSEEDDDGHYDGTMDDPQYQIIAHQADMYWKGEFGLDKDPNKAGELFSWAAELATEAMKGKLASKYYMQAEEAWGECEEEE